ncbi:dihydrodipicolinate synthase/N-acetylneuraminate lyase [Terriglobus roseus DSM 18391]|uniref:Dihydrodipicolinate synthase/N-acetylneuraminate lyase n=1 Tax=Terriglobus roseus (strain DSM 18391 / NRRL B-41598 / KBS 63) TaxID=926566 RepID=I3ZDZ9_TERRK|nr:dihydrodipicolinate synthase family protein [Terriglobus roseus]AFL87467.1 dihydrodipicolinate synthase/N-acetylneuraminate lyase [Terriglobus roseus DSM 18391]
MKTGLDVKLLKGIVVPTVTPLTRSGALDEVALRLLLSRIVAGGVSGIFALGTTGEGPALGRGIRRRAVEVTCEVVDGRMPVVVAAIETSVDDVLRTSEHAAAAGADAIAIAPPFYMALGQADIVRFGRQVADESKLPAYLYNVPFGNLPQFNVRVLEALSGLDPILGLKDSSGDFEQLKQAIAIFAGRPECSVLVGPERMLLAALRERADGGVCGGANLLPHLYVHLYEAYLRDDVALSDALQQRVVAVEEDFYGVGAAESGLVRGLKTALEVQGIGTAVMAPPYASPSEEEYAEIRKTLLRWKDVAVSEKQVMV